MERKTVDDVTHAAEVVGFISTACVEEEAQTGKVAGQRFGGHADAIWESGDLGRDGGLGGKRRGQAERRCCEGSAVREEEGPRWPAEGSAGCPQYHPGLNRPPSFKEKLFSTPTSKLHV
jgi:hypothetical protein